MTLSIDKIVSDVRSISPPGSEGLAERVVRRTAELQGLAAAGVDVDHDMAVLGATAANLDERTRTAIAEEVSRWTYLVLSTVIRVGLGVPVPPPR